MDVQYLVFLCNKVDIRRRLMMLVAIIHRLNENCLIGL